MFYNGINIGNFFFRGFESIRAFCCQTVCCNKGLFISLTHVLAQAERDKVALAERKFQLERSVEELKLRNAELDEFTHIVSHDLQEPLRKLMSFCGLLERDIGDHVPERARTDMDFITDWEVLHRGEPAVGRVVFGLEGRWEYGPPGPTDLRGRT